MNGSRFAATVGPPHSDESLLGYVTRALSVASVDHLPTALRLAGAAQPKHPLSIATTLKKSDEIARLSHLIGCKPEDIASRTHRGGGKLPQYQRRFELMDCDPPPPAGDEIQARLAESPGKGALSPRRLGASPIFVRPRNQRDAAEQLSCMQTALGGSRR
jgi:hypothetical protein